MTLHNPIWYVRIEPIIIYGEASTYVIPMCLIDHESHPFITDTWIRCKGDIGSELENRLAWILGLDRLVVE